MKCNSLGLLFCTILFPNHISGLFSQGHDLSLPGTEQQSGVDGGYPAESAVRCDKLMANLTRRRCQAGRGGSCWRRDSALAAAHINVAWKTCFRHHRDDVYELWFLLKGEAWTEGEQRPAVGEAPVDLSQQRGCAANDCSPGWVPHHGGWKSVPTCGLTYLRGIFWTW